METEMKKQSFMYIEFTHKSWYWYQSLGSPSLYEITWTSGISGLLLASLMSATYVHVLDVPTYTVFNDQSDELLRAMHVSHGELFVFVQVKLKFNLLYFFGEKKVHFSWKYTCTCRSMLFLDIFGFDFVRLSRCCNLLDLQF